MWFCVSHLSQLDIHGYSMGENVLRSRINVARFGKERRLGPSTYIIINIFQSSIQTWVSIVQAASVMIVSVDYLLLMGL